MLWQGVGNGEPGRFRSNENMSSRCETGGIQERSKCHVDVLTIADERVEERTTQFAPGIVAGLVTVQHETVFPLGDAVLGSFDSAERLEG